MRHGCWGQTGISITESAYLLGFSRTIYRVYVQRMAQKGAIVSGNCVNKNALLMSKVRGEWADA